MLTKVAKTHHGTRPVPARFKIDVAPSAVAAAIVQVSVAATDRTDIANGPPNVANAVAQQIGHTESSLIVRLHLKRRPDWGTM
jgi:hypothetical protein